MSEIEFSVEIQNEADYEIDEARLRQAALTVLAAHDIQPGSEMTVAITDNEAVAALNLRFRGVDAPTDVLSFPMNDDMPGEVRYLGDLAIAYPYASAQAAREGHALSDSLALLVVHGTLHILGYDHDTPERKAEMWGAQAAALVRLGIPVEIVPALEASVHEAHDGDDDEPQG